MPLLLLILLHRVFGPHYVTARLSPRSKHLPSPPNPRRQVSRRGVVGWQRDWIWIVSLRQSEGKLNLSHEYNQITKESEWNAGKWFSKFSKSHHHGEASSSPFYSLSPRRELIAQQSFRGVILVLANFCQCPRIRLMYVCQLIILRTGCDFMDVELQGIGEIEIENFSAPILSHILL